MIKTFFDEKCFFFYLVRYTEFYGKKKQEKSSSKHDGIIFAKCMKLV